MGRTSLGAGALLGVLLAVAAGAAVWARAGIELPAPPLPRPVRIDVAPREPVAAVGRELERSGVIRHRALFVALAAWRGADRRIRSGEFEFRGGASLVDVLDHLVHGPVVEMRILLPEGLTAREIAERLEGAGLGPAKRFRELADDPAFAAELDLPAPRLEGFLFPDTYRFAKGTPPRAVLARMVERFREVFTPEMEREAKAAGLSLLQAVTLASLIEKEAAVDEERSIISAVFHNRLARGMRLQSDPTAVYDLPDHRGPVRRRDLERPSPYNTYRIRGLPPGPIANPGRASLEAAIHPAPGVDALYFVARDDRTHEFTRSLREHRRAIRRRRRRRRAAADS